MFESCLLSAKLISSENFWHAPAAVRSLFLCLNHFLKISEPTNNVTNDHFQELFFNTLLESEDLILDWFLCGKETLQEEAINTYRSHPHGTLSPPMAETHLEATQHFANQSQTTSSKALSNVLSKFLEPKFWDGPQRHRTLRVTLGIALAQQEWEHDCQILKDSIEGRVRKLSESPYITVPCLVKL